MSASRKDSRGRDRVRPGAVAAGPERPAVRRSLWPFVRSGARFRYLLAALVTLLLTSPAVVDGRGWRVALGASAGAVLVASLHAAKPGRRVVAVGVALAAVDLAVGQLVFLEGGRWLVAVQAALWLATLLYVTSAILFVTFRTRDVDVETLQAALCVYLMIGLMWVYVYALISLAAPGSFRIQGGRMPSWTDPQSRSAEFVRLLVFSFSTLSGSGRGDVTPATGFACMCVNLESLSAQVYLAVVVARLVGMQAAGRQARTTAERDG